MKGAHIQTLWSLSVVLLLVGYFMVYRPYEDRIATSINARADVVDILRRNDVILAGRGRLEQRGRNLSRGLRRIQLQSDPAELVALFVRETARVAALHRLTVSAIEGTRGETYPPQRALTSQLGAGQAKPAANEPRPLFEVVPLDLTLNGSYADILRAIGELSHARVLAEIGIVSLERVPDADGKRLLTARLHVNLDRLVTTEVRGSAVNPT